MTESRFLLAGLLSLAAAIAPRTATTAEPDDAPPELREYAVEVVVFRYADGVYRGTELFPPDPPPEEPPVEAGIPEFGDAPAPAGIGESPVEAPVGAEEQPALPADGDGDADSSAEDATADQGPGYTVMLDSELAMGETLDRLERLDAYEPILHFGWRQRLTAFAESEPIPLARLAAPPPGLDGSFELYLSRFLHLALELEQEAEPGPPDARLGRTRTDPLFDARSPAAFGTEPFANLGSPPGIYYRISEDRIFKSGDLRYFDHPKFGVLVKIDRVEREETDPDAPPAGEEMLGDLPPER